MSQDVFFHAFVYLSAALVAVPVANRLGLGSVLGYLLAGVVIGPFALNFVGREGEEVMHFAEFGVVMMLFLIGLELRPNVLWTLRRSILGMGGAQVLLTSLAAAGAAFSLGMDPGPALAIGMILSLSSTAIVLQSLTEKGLMRTEGGQTSFSVLLFQDIAVIPMIALIPLLAPAGATIAAAEAAAHGDVTSRPAWLQAILVLVVVGGIILGGRFLVRPLFRFLAMARQREVFTAAALFLVVGITILMQMVGLSAALGTFVAGVVLAESEYRHELEGDIEPFKGLLLGLFFISVGASIDFELLMGQPIQLVGLAVGLIGLKFVVLFAVARTFGLKSASGWVFAFALAQGGEFAFVLASLASSSHVLGPEQVGPLVLIVALSMILTPLMLLLLERVVLPRATRGATERPADVIEEHDNMVIIAGFGRFGQIVGRMLRSNGYGITILDHDPELISSAERVGVKVHYGDASRLELLAAAGCAHAKLFVLAIDDREKSLQIAAAVRKHFPDLKIVARAWDRVHYLELRSLGLEHVFRETFASALEAATASLEALGQRAHRAYRAAQAYRAFDEKALRELEHLWGGDEKLYFDAIRRANAEAERLLRGSTVAELAGINEAFDNEELRAPDESA